MTIRLTLLAPAPAAAPRGARVDDDGPLDEAGRRQVRAVAAGVPSARRHLTSPSGRCRQTAAELGLDAEVETDLRELDLGSWHGRTLDELAAGEPEALAEWTTDPASAPHGGESVVRLCRRIGDWLDHLPGNAGRVLAVTPASVARASVVHALGAPPDAFWRIDVPPLTQVRLTGRNHRWNLRFG
ncbi:histidine phosphatase family protein [Streptomyces sp. MS06]|uniref:histidine phosphatase family protein n=1 Tax=Streptomyces sp. MS06 TaxID=3385974 RepID=UPI00399FBD3F